MKCRLQILVVLAVMVGSASAADLFTNVYTVPPTFLNSLDHETEDGNPFTDPVKNVPRPKAKSILENAGITFSPECSAIYNPSNSQLIVRNTQDQMELVEAYIESIQHVVEKQIYVTFREYNFAGDPFTGEKNPIPGFGLTGLLSPQAACAPIKEGQRSLSFNSNKDFFEELSRPPRPPEKETEQKPAGGISGVFTDPQYQVIARSLNQNEKVEKLDLPSIMVRSGKAGMVQVDKNRYGVIAVVGADGFTIDLQLYIPKAGKALFEKNEEPDTPLKITIWDGQTISYVESNSEEESKRLIFVKATIMDPAGQPVNGNHPRYESNKSRDLSEAGKDLVKRSDNAALRGSKLMAEGSFREAAENYEAALNLLPEHELTEDRASAYRKQLNRALDTLAENPGTPKKRASVHIVKTGESIYGIAKQHDTSVGRLAAHNNLESESIDVGQLLRLPGGGAIGNALLPERSIEGILRETIIPEIQYDNLPFPDALGHLISEIERLGSNQTAQNLTPKVVIEDAGETPEVQITLKLVNAPAFEALRYVTALARCKYRLDGATIFIEPLD